MILIITTTKAMPINQIKWKLCFKGRCCGDTDFISLLVHQVSSAFIFAGNDSSVDSEPPGFPIGCQIRPLTPVDVTGSEIGMQTLILITVSFFLTALRLLLCHDHQISERFSFMLLSTEYKSSKSQSRQRINE